MLSWRTTEAKDRDQAYWFKKVSQFNSMYGCIIVAAKKVEVMEQVCSLDREAIDRLSSKLLGIDEQEDELRSGSRGQLMYH